MFPDGVRHVWNDARDAPKLASREGVDDVAFLRALIDELASEQGTSTGPVYLAGISNGALFAEYVARQALVPVAGLGLVAGTGTVTSRQTLSVPRQPARVVAFAGTADPLVPYGGGPIRLMGRLAQRRGAAGRGLAAPAEEVAADWAAANGCPSEANLERVSIPGGIPVTRLSWRAPGRPAVELYRIEGGGHTWPGGAQYLPERFVGPVAKGLNATGLVVEAFGVTKG